ncbi:ABC transporter ATP-binding protein [Arcanobacterium bovis]|uniref:ATP-binding cassette domain-containing protein n=1 Tax=Arcanobacterium bovis TaxID=2529275 RepID=A0A4Q9V1U1_9ACTO|nr:ATP-binding cassette domain-containing protein [Arcanobacterium bovis]TBW23023.1 ATP-binding cassette domain-containing protein [Arcanobacterium bovis]
MASVTLNQATRIYPGAQKPAVDHLDLHIDDGECVVFVGPSGCGKSTSLRMVAGLEPLDSGQVLIGDRDITNLRPKARDVAMVFQSYALYPNMTVAQNLAFALENQKVPKPQIKERIEWAARLLEIHDLLDRKPGALSGGQRQRVAMGRAIVRKPTVFCMDEPLSNLDAKLRVTMRAEIAALQRELGVTTIYVTHDQVEAMTMGHRVAVLADGHLQQIDTPTNLYRHPANMFVAGFIGSPAISFFTLPIVEDGTVYLGNYPIRLPRTVTAQLDKEITIGIRPESWTPAREEEPSVSLKTSIVEQLGNQSFLYGDVEHVSGSSRVAVLLPRNVLIAPNSEYRAQPITEELYYFDPRTGNAVWV